MTAFLTINLWLNLFRIKAPARFLSSRAAKCLFAFAPAETQVKTRDESGDLFAPTQLIAERICSLSKRFASSRVAFLCRPSQDEPS